MYNIYFDRNYRLIILNLLYYLLTCSFENDVVNIIKIIKIMNNSIIISQSIINKMK